MGSPVIFAISAIFLVGLPMNTALSGLPGPGEITWPTNCANKSYCTDKPTNYPTDFFDKILDTVDLDMRIGRGVENRTTGLEDVAGCKSKLESRLIHMIKDEHENIWFVAQHKNFQFELTIEDCKHPGTISEKQARDHFIMKQHNVQCYETKLPILFPVLSRDGSKLVSVAAKGGISVGCSAKVKRRR